MRRVGVLVVLCGVAAGMSDVEARGQGLPGNVLVVRQQAAPGGDGLTWATAFDDIYDALAAVQASGGTRNEIWMTTGAYGRRTCLSNACGTIPVAISMQGVTVRGGFVGTETLASQRVGTTDSRIEASQFIATTVELDRVGITQLSGSGPFCNGHTFRITGSRLIRSSLGSAAPNWGVGGVQFSQSVAEDTGLGCGVEGNGSTFVRVVAQGGKWISGGTWYDSTLAPRADENSYASGFISSVYAVRCKAKAYVLEGGAAAVGGCIFVSSVVDAAKAGQSPVSGCVFYNSTVVASTPDSTAFAGCRFFNSIVYPSYQLSSTSSPYSNCSFFYSTLPIRQFPEGGEGNIRAEINLPVGAEAALLHTLTPPSARIDNGNNDLVPPGLFTDINGNPRFAGTATPSPGVGAAPRVDRGAVEAELPGYVVTTPRFCYANMDGSVDSSSGTAVPSLTMEDFGAFLAFYRSGHPLANCDESTGVPRLSPADFSCFLAKYRAGCS